ncbi:MAG: hypothetical protein LUH57_02920 [Ruminococcus sp.]|nr:hypothetical protein [Ruminococcus sp.]
MESEKIKIQLDFLSGPIWPNYLEKDTFKKITGVKVIDDDLQLGELNRKVCDLYSSYYEFDSHDMPCWFNYEQQFKDRFIIRDLLQKIVNRLNEINDGSYVVEPFALNYYNELCTKDTYEDLNKK